MPWRVPRTGPVMTEEEALVVDWAGLVAVVEPVVEPVAVVELELELPPQAASAVHRSVAVRSVGCREVRRMTPRYNGRGRHPSAPGRAPGAGTTHASAEVPTGGRARS